MEEGLQHRQERLSRARHEEGRPSARETQLGQRPGDECGQSPGLGQLAGGRERLAPSVGQVSGPLARGAGSPRGAPQRKGLATGSGLGLSLWWVSRDRESQGGCLRRGRASHTAGPRKPPRPPFLAVLGLLGHPRLASSFPAPSPAPLLIYSLSSPPRLRGPGGWDCAHVGPGPLPCPKATPALCPESVFRGRPLGGQVGGVVLPLVRLPDEAPSARHAALEPR